MASAILHIRDSYYFEVPKFLWPSNRRSIGDFPDVWVRLDDEYQLWEGERIYERLVEECEGRLAIPSWGELRDEYLAWKSHHENFAKPLDVYLEERAAEVRADYEKWADEPANVGRSLGDFVEATNPPAGWFARLADDEGWAETWREILDEAEGVEEFADSHEWSTAKLNAYNSHLSGKILVPQVFGGKLRNLYEPEAGVCISKFMCVQLVVALLLVAAFTWLARRVGTGGPPKGRLWNALEAILLYFRDQVVRPTLAHPHDDDHGHGEGHGASEGHGHGHGEADNPYAEADRFLPLIWTMFVFILGCNLMGMVPWVGAPTGAFSVTTGLAAIVLCAGFVIGIRKFGVGGFVLNPISSMKLPLYVAIFVLPMLLVIEWVGFLIRHLVLAIRLLANMVAGHLVLAAIMGLAFGAAAAATFHGQPFWKWALTAVIAIFGSSAFSLLELFVAFLQAYVFVFLSTLFLATATQKH